MEFTCFDLDTMSPISALTFIHEMFPEYGLGASKPFGAHLLNFQRRQVSIQPIPVHFPISRGDTVDEIQAEFWPRIELCAKHRAPSLQPRVLLTCLLLHLVPEVFRSSALYEK